jgi:hypothetical protein
MLLAAVLTASAAAALLAQAALFTAQSLSAAADSLRLGMPTSVRRRTKNSKVGGEARQRACSDEVLTAPRRCCARVRAAPLLELQSLA